MLGNPSGGLAYDPEIERTARANRKSVRLAKEAARLARLEQEEENSSPYISEDESIDMGDQANPPPPPRRTLGDYGRRNDGEIANLGFQLVNPLHLISRTR
ncbi:hypothetical protein A2U01_0055339, partial [Trifolium medium]|nr:hypothetical protein [Trifolium medium]